MSVNGIIRLMESVCLGPNVIPLSGALCIIKKSNDVFKQSDNIISDHIKRLSLYYKNTFKLKIHIFLSDSFFSICLKLWLKVRLEVWLEVPLKVRLEVWLEVQLEVSLEDLLEVPLEVSSETFLLLVGPADAIIGETKFQIFTLNI